MTSHDIEMMSLIASGLQKFAILLVFFALIAAEKYFAYRPNDRETVRRSYTTNLGMLIFNDTLLSILSVSSLLMVAENYSGFGLLSWVSSMSIKAFVSFVLLDLMLYWWHRARHERPFLWRFHKVHHSDLVMNTTTTFRLHIVEVFLTTVAKSVFIVVLGVPTSILLFSEMIITMFVMMNHTNISFRGEKLVSRIFVVPSKHVVHHSVRVGEQHRNFGFALSIWDTLFHTCKRTVPEELGLLNVGEQGFWSALVLRFERKQ